ncbi:hypothetical protein [Nonomuraea sp. JJY05]
MGGVDSRPYPTTASSSKNAVGYGGRATVHRYMFDWLNGIFSGE